MALLIIPLQQHLHITFFLICKSKYIKQKRPIATQYTGDIQGDYNLSTKKQKRPRRPHPP